MDTGIFLRTRIVEACRVLYANEETKLQNTTVRREVHIKWMAPPPGWFTLNTDGASKGSPGLAGGGGVLRDDRGAFIRGFAANLGVCSAYKAEVAAAEYGLTMAKKHGHKQANPANG